jgi:hypothetical protein
MVHDEFQAEPRQPASSIRGCSGQRPLGARSLESSVPRSRTLKGVAAALAGILVSRNNDIGGYWGPGLLLVDSSSNGGAVVFDLLRQATSPSTPSTLEALVAHEQALARRLQLGGFTLADLEVAEVAYQFHPASPDGHPRGALARYVCTVTLSNRRGRRYSVSAAGTCRPHNPRFEHRRARS